LGVTRWPDRGSGISQDCPALAVAFLNATIIEVILASGLIGIYIDSFAERRWQRWRRIRRLSTRRQARLRELERQASFGGGYLTWALAEERVRRQNEAADEVDLDVESPTRRSGPILLLASMPILAKLGLLLALRPSSCAWAR